MINDCELCLEKQQEIDRLHIKIDSLEARLRYQKKKEKEGYFGSSTPSSQKPIKPNSKNKKKGKKGGAKNGHKGHGRTSINENNADIVKELNGLKSCPYCNVYLKDHGQKTRSVKDIIMIKPLNILYKINIKKCPKCKKKYKPSPPSVLPRNLYGNNLISQMAAMHFYHGIPVGRISKMFGISTGSIINIFHKLAGYFEPWMKKLIKEYRLSPVKFADETGWRNDGNNGYGWGFFTKETSIFDIADTRSSKIALKIFGDGPLPGVLVVDRYGGYNKIKIKIQYCYEHLKRNTEDLLKAQPDSREVQDFVEKFTSLLKRAMRLRNLEISDKEFYKCAKKLKKGIKSVVLLPASNEGILHIQQIFINNAHRMYHWADDRNVPAENNFSERQLRGLVIARKISFGSSSDKGARTRSILMSIIHTLDKRLNHQPIEVSLKNILNKIAKNPKRSIMSLLPKNLDIVPP